MTANKFSDCNQMIKKLSSICFFVFILLAFDSYAVDLVVFQEQCEGIGFKINTQENGKCVLKLIKSATSQKSKKVVQQKAYEQEQQDKREVEARTAANNLQIMQQQQTLRQQPVQQNNENGTSFLDVLGLGIQLLGVSAQVYNQNNGYSAPYINTIQAVPVYQAPRTTTCKTKVLNTNTLRTTCAED